MTLLIPQIDSVRRVFRKHSLLSITCTTIAVGLGAFAFGSRSSAEDAPASPQHIKAVTSKIDGKAIEANGAKTQDWPTIGLDYAETRFSKLKQINADNVKNLGLKWTYNLESVRGIEADVLPDLTVGISKGSDCSRTAKANPRRARRLASTGSKLSMGVATNMTPLLMIGGASWPSSTPVENVHAGARFLTFEALIWSSGL